MILEFRRVLVEYNENRYGYDKKRSGYHTAEKLCGSRFFSFPSMIERTDQNKNAADHVDRRSIAKARRTGMVRLALLWWRWGELNPRPKAL